MVFTPYRSVLAEFCAEKRGKTPFFVLKRLPPPVTEFFNKLLIISIIKLYFFCIYIQMVHFSSTQRGHFFNFSSETCLSQKVQSHGLCKFCSFPKAWVDPTLSGIFQKPGWNFPQAWVEISCFPPVIPDWLTLCGDIVQHNRYKYDT